MTVQELYERIGGSYEDAKRVLQIDRLVAKYIQKYLDDRSCEQMLSAWEQGNAAGIFEGAHAMKGVCANLGLTALSARASAVAEEFRPGSVRTMDDGQLARLMEEIRRDQELPLAGIRAFAQEQ